MMRARLLSTFVLLGALGATTTGCRTDSTNIQAWGSKSQGPRKLVAVLTHDKYPTDLRIEAAMMLVSMKPRGGRRIGIQGTDEQPGLIDALAQMQPASRTAIVTRLVPKLQQEMLKPLPAAQAGVAVADATIPYKDAAFALLTHDDGALLTDEGLRKGLKATLATWAATNFADRLDDTSQMFGMEQVLRELKADGVRSLPDLMVPGANKIDRMSQLIADFGDDATKAKASEKLVAVALEVNSAKWIEQKAGVVEAANKASKLNPKPEQFKAQVAQYQEEELTHVLASMKKVGGKPAVAFLLGFAQDKTQSDKRRSAALAALQGHLDKKDTTHAAAVLAIAGASDTPDPVRDQALARVGELPRPLVIDKLYDLFKDPNWKVRQVAAQLVLKMSETPQLPEFFTHLGKADNMTITEALRYGALLSGMKGTPTPAEVAEKYAASGRPVQNRLAALGYYYTVGTAADVGKISAYTSDKTATPKGKADNMTITEALRYGALLSGMKGTPTPAEIAQKYAASGHPVQNRLAALGYYYNVGTAADVGKISGYTSDKTATPKCKADAKDCDWKCEVQGEKGPETKEVSTLGEFVEYCVKPAMEKNKAAK